MYTFNSTILPAETQAFMFSAGQTRLGVMEIE